MGLIRRILIGAEAGLLAGASIVALFLVLDVIRLAPMATPLALAEGLWGEPSPVTTDALFADLVPVLRQGVQVVGYTLAHLATFALLGAVSPFVVRASTFGLSILGGVTFGTLGSTGAFLASRWVVGAPLVPAGIPLATLLLANVLAGAVLGMGLHAGLSDTAAPE